MVFRFDLSQGLWQRRQPIGPGNEDVVEAFKIILASRRKPEKIITDQGTEFFNKHFKALLKDEDIELYNTYNETKASVVGRLIRTLKTRM